MKKLTHELSLGVWILGMLGVTGLMTVPAHAQAVPEPTTAQNILMQNDGAFCDPQGDQTQHT